MTKFRIEVDTSSIKRGFREFTDDLTKGVEAVTLINAQEIERNAKQMAPVDLGTLRHDIATEEISKLEYDIIAHAPYSAYQEFGTGGLVDVPEGWEDIAIQFKGEGIRKVNMPAQPFMYPAFKIAEKQYPKDINDEIDYQTKKFNQ